MNLKMKAVMFYGPKEIRLVEVPLPKPGPGEMRIKVGSGRTCGTDFKAYRQGHPVLLGKLPSLFGHELAGTVVEVGPGVKRFKTGDRVVAAIHPRDDCFFACGGQNQLCDDSSHNGAYADTTCSPPKSSSTTSTAWETPGASPSRTPRWPSRCPAPSTPPAFSG